MGVSPASHLIMALVQSTLSVVVVVSSVILPLSSWEEVPGGSFYFQPLNCFIALSNSLFRPIRDATSVKQPARISLCSVCQKHSNSFPSRFEFHFFSFSLSWKAWMREFTILSCNVSPKKSQEFMCSVLEQHSMWSHDAWSSIWGPGGMRADYQAPEPASCRWSGVGNTTSCLLFSFYLPSSFMVTLIKQQR